MATFTVTTPDDVVPSDGKLSLREAMTQANATTAADTIVFASGLEGKTLTLTGGELVLRQDVTVDGDQNNDRVEVTLSGGNTQRIVRTSGTGTDVVLTDLAVTDGFIDSGAKGGDALLAAQVLQYDADLLFSRKMPARRAPDVFDDLLCRRFYRLGFLSHLRS